MNDNVIRVQGLFKPKEDNELSSDINNSVDLSDSQKEPGLSYDQASNLHAII
jgi:hypothetical protein